jgi:hypothetical protein
LILLQASLLHNDGRRISLRDGYKEAHEEIVNNGKNSMPVPRGSDKRSWRRKTPKKQSVSVYLIHAANIGGFLRNGLNSQVLATQEIALLPEIRRIPPSAACLERFHHRVKWPPWLPDQIKVADRTQFAVGGIRNQYNNSSV